MSELNCTQQEDSKSTSSGRSSCLEFKPTYLYIKTHNETGLKYFGKTTRKNPFKYKGSGKRWLNHLKVHGSNFSTEIVGFFEDENSCVDAAKKFCEDNNIVEDSAWANLKEENGVDGGYIGSEARKIMSEKAIERVLKGTHHFIGPEMNRRSIANGTNVFAKGDEVRQRVKNGTHLFLNKEWHKESSRKSIESGKHNFLGGRIQREQVLKGTHPFLNGEMQRRNIIKRFQEGKHPTQIKKVCPYCNKEENSTLFAKYHGDKCPMKNSTQISFL